MLRRILRIFILFLLILSLALLVWGLWPGETLIKTLPISPLEMQLPTPTSLKLTLSVFV
jgi:hypothetical protein